MQESFLHYVWKYLKFSLENLQTTCGQSIKILHNGHYLEQEGPDFFNAKIQIGDQLWAGNVELHLKSSDWNNHQHQTDTNYNNVILHVVWEHNKDIYTQSNHTIPTLELKNYVDKDLVHNFATRFSMHKDLPCLSQCEQTSKDKNRLFQQALIIKRFNQQSAQIEQHLARCQNYWEACFIQRLFMYFGTSINREAFADVMHHTPYRIIQQERFSEENLLALLYGQARLLSEEPTDEFSKQLHKTYHYLQQKHQLQTATQPVQFFKLRPANFPTIRIAQFVRLVVNHPSFFFEVNQLQSLEEFYTYFESTAHPYWDNAYTFHKKTSKSHPKKLSKSFIELLLLNVVFPMLYTHRKHHQPEMIDSLLELYEQMAFEHNHITQKFPSANFMKKNAADSQSLLYLYNHYCQHKKCLQCNVGLQIVAK